MSRASISENGYLFFVSDPDSGEITFKNINDEGDSHTKISAGEPVSCVRVTSDGKRLIVHGSYDNIKIWTFGNGEQPCKHNAVPSRVIGYSDVEYTKTLSNDGKLLAYHAKNEMGRIKIVDTTTLVVVQEFEELQYYRNVVLSNDNKKIALSWYGKDGQDYAPNSRSSVVVYDIATKKHIVSRKFSGYISCMIATRREDEFAMIVGENILHIWNSRSDTFSDFFNLKCAGEYHCENFILNSDNSMVAYASDIYGITLQDKKGNYMRIDDRWRSLIMRFTGNDTGLLLCDKMRFKLYNTRFAPFWTIFNHKSFRADSKVIGYIFIAHQALGGRDSSRYSPLLQVPRDILLLILSFFQRLF